jgi:hypothetical protein
MTRICPGDPLHHADDPTTPMPSDHGEREQEHRTEESGLPPERHGIIGSALRRRALRHSGFTRKCERRLRFQHCRPGLHRGRSSP